MDVPFQYFYIKIIATIFEILLIDTKKVSIIYLITIQCQYQGKAKKVLYQYIHTARSIEIVPRGGPPF